MRKYGAQPTNWNAFGDLKAYAKMAAKTALEKNMTDGEMKEKLFDKFSQTSKVWECNNLAIAYRDYLTGKISKEQAEQATEQCKIEWNEIEEAINEIFGWQIEANKAMKAKGIEFGTVEFICPKCGGKAHYACYDTPENIAHSATIRGYCEGTCGHSVMN